MRIDIDQLAFYYSQGLKFRKIELIDIMNFTPSRLLYFAEEFNIKPEDYKTSKEEVKDYINVLFFNRKKYESFFMIKRNETETDRWLLFSLIIGIISGLIALIFHSFYYAKNIFVLAAIISAILFFKIDKMYYKYMESKFFKEIVPERNYNIEKFINEVMFQVYLKNRNPLKE